MSRCGALRIEHEGLCRRMAMVIVIMVMIMVMVMVVPVSMVVIMRNLDATTSLIIRHFLARRTSNDLVHI